MTQSFLRLSGSCSKNIGAFFFFLALAGIHVQGLKGFIDFYSSATWITSVIKNLITIPKTHMDSS